MSWLLMRMQYGGKGEAEGRRGVLPMLCQRITTCSPSIETRQAFAA